MKDIYVCLPKACSLLLFLLLARPLAAQYVLPANGTEDVQLNVAAGTVMDDGGAAAAYTPNYRGALTLTPPAGQVITLTFTTFDTEIDLDLVAVYDGPNTTYPLLLCPTSGNALPGPLVGTHPDGLTIVLTSDGSFEGAGFEATIGNAPAGASPPRDTYGVPFLGTYEITACAGTVYDNGGVGCNYLNNSGTLDGSGVLVIRPALPNHAVRLNFSAADMELTFAPPHPDRLYIYDGADQTAPILSMFSELPSAPLTANTGDAPNPDGALTLYFLSDFSEMKAGFAAAISCVPLPTARFLNADTTICAGDSAVMRLELTGNGPYNIEYTDGVQIFHLNNVAGPVYQWKVSPAIGSTTYQIRSFADSEFPRGVILTPDEVIVDVTPAPTATAGANALTICVGSAAQIPIILSGTPPFTLVINDGVQDNIVTNILTQSYTYVANPVANTTYTIVSVADALCSNGAVNNGVIAVTVSPPPTAALSTPGFGAVCPGGLTVLKIDLTGPGPWDVRYSDGAQTYLIQNLTQTPHFFAVQPSQPTTYTLTSVTSPNCPPGTVSGTVLITILTPPAVEPVVSIDCSTGLGLITVNVTGGTQPYNYSFDGGATFQLSNFVSRPQSPQPYAIVVQDANGCSGTASARVDGLTAPTITQFTDLGTNSVRVWWTPTGGQGARYKLRYRIYNSANTWAEIANIPTFTQKVFGLQSATTYEFEVKIVCAGGLESDWSLRDTVTTLGEQLGDCAALYPPMPTGVYIDQLTPTSVRINWNSVIGPGYILAIGLANANPLTWPQYVICNGTPISARTSYIVSGLSPGRAYRVRVRTNCSNCTTALKNTDRRSGWTLIIEFTTPLFREAADEDAAWPTTVYPNPNQGEFSLRIEAPAAGKARLRVTDVTGRTVFEQETALAEGRNERPISLGSVASGLYVLQIQTEDRSVTTRILVR